MTTHAPAPDIGLVVAGHGRHYIVETPEGRRIPCHPRGKKSEAVVGDRVHWRATHEGARGAAADDVDEGVIEKIEPRRNLLYRQDEWKTKSFAANLDQLLVWVAVEPVFSESQLTRALIAAESVGLEACVCLNKTDLPQTDAQRERLAPYRAMGYTVLEGSLSQDIEAWRATLAPRLAGRASLVLGPSGTGKSTLVNALVPDARAQVGEISQALNSGRHTTTTTQWYWLDVGEGFDRAALIDSPGFQEFGLRQLEPAQIAQLMPDLREHAGGCRFYNCSHRHEPGCAVLAAVERGEISASRSRIYAALYEELSQTRW
ncbi:ribosome small subunit-dependent GTPase A [Caldimonas sp. KR1-144]|uniref:ribosome small subunit-dependent GTPase A n=1 Tax=Caldimonas sp. KR1-144 TaxID=3400911 RepID=UPI003C110028